MRKIYIVSPTKVATGGTELLQQLCQSLIRFNEQCYMYYTDELAGSPVEKKFAAYNNPVAKEIEDTPENILVLPETAVDWYYKFKNIKIYFWWLSVDNYYASGRKPRDLLHNVVYKIKDLRNVSAFKKSAHLIQSEYAREYLTQEKGVDPSRIQVLSDYLNRTYLEKAQVRTNTERNNVILYNPKKGLEFTKRLMEVITEYTWVPLQNLTNDEMRDLMMHSKVYVDFGNHPGKDRIPREAAICGCCIITGKRGAAANAIDVPIKHEYKFADSDSEITKIHHTVKLCMEHFENRQNDFSDYIQMINNEEEKFYQDIRRIFEISDT